MLLVEARVAPLALQRFRRRFTSASVPRLLIQLAEEQRFAHVMHGDRLGPREVGDGPCHPQDPAAGTRRKVEASRR